VHTRSWRHKEDTDMQVRVVRNGSPVVDRLLSHWLTTSKYYTMALRAYLRQQSDARKRSSSHPLAILTKIKHKHYLNIVM